MTEQSPTTKPKQPPKPRAKKEHQVLTHLLPEALDARITLLEQALSKLATLTGNGNMLHQFGLKPWQPTKEDMKKHAS